MRDHPGLAVAGAAPVHRRVSGHWMGRMDVSLCECESRCELGRGIGTDKLMRQFAATYALNCGGAITNPPPLTRSLLTRTSHSNHGCPYPATTEHTPITAIACLPTCLPAYLNGRVEGRKVEQASWDDILCIIVGDFNAHGPTIGSQRFPLPGGSDGHP